MKTAMHQQVGNPNEALGLLSRPVIHWQQSQVIRIAARIGGLPDYQRRTAQTITAALSIFGGRVIAVETHTT